MTRRQALAAPFAASAVVIDLKANPGGNCQTIDCGGVLTKPIAEMIAVSAFWQRSEDQTLFAHPIILSAFSRYCHGSTPLWRAERTRNVVVINTAFGRWVVTPWDKFEDPRIVAVSVSRRDGQHTIRVLNCTRYYE